MLMQSRFMIEKVLEMQAAAYACEVRDFSRSENLVLRASPERPLFRMIGFGNNTVVSTHDAFRPWCDAWFGRVEGIFCFDAPQLVEIGLAMRDFSFVLDEIFDWYLPLRVPEQSFAIPAHLTFTHLENDQVGELYQHKGFDNALTYHDLSATKMALAVYHDDVLCAVAGANPYYEDLWCIGIDVIPEYRKQGLATYLVHTLTKKMLEKDVIPMYPTWYSNIGSRHTALRAGYLPVWVEIGSETTL